MTKQTNICLTEGVTELKIQVFWDVMLRSQLDSSCHFETAAHHFHLQGQEARNWHYWTNNTAQHSTTQHSTAQHPRQLEFYVTPLWEPEMLQSHYHLEY